MDNYVHRRDLIDSNRLLQLSSKSNIAGITRLAIHLALLTAGGFWVWSTYGSWWVVPAWVVYGILMAFLFAPLHESIHRTAFRCRYMNAAVSSAAGFILLLPANYFRHFHFAHHRYTNDVENDPELQVSKPAGVPSYLWAMSGLGSYWWPQIRLIAKHCAGNVDSKFIPQSEHARIKLEARIHVIGYVGIALVSIYFENTLALVCWVVPVLMGMVALRFFLLAEHAGCKISDNMLVNTRTTLTNPLIRLVAWNMSYHCEHHLFPSVPFHRLPALHSEVRDRLGVVSNGYSNFHSEYLRSFRQ